MTEEQVVLKCRQGTPFDMTNLMRLMEMAYQDGEQYETYAPVNNEKLMQWVQRVLITGHVFVVEKSGRLIGSISVTPFQFPWSDHWFMNIEWLYVVKKYRSSQVAEALFTALHRLADEQGAPITGAISSVADAEIKDRLMRMKGYTYLGGLFVRGAQHGI